MRFASISHISSALNVKTEANNNQDISLIRKELGVYFNQNSEIKILDYPFSKVELEHIIGQLNDEKIWVFHDWIDLDLKLQQFLVSAGEKIIEGEVVLYEEHQLFSSYQSFVSSYLQPILENRLTLAIEQWDLKQIVKLLSFSSLLTQSLRIDTQNSVSDFVHRVLKSIKRIDMESRKQVYSQDFIQVLNALDPFFYSERIFYVDTIKDFMNDDEYDSSHSRMVKSALLNLDLRPHHHDQVKEFCSSSVFASSKKTFPEKTRYLLKSPVVLLFLILIMGSLIFLIFKENNTNTTDQTTGADALTEEELTKADSLLNIKNASTQTEETEYFNSSTFQPWKNLQNIKAKELYQCFLEDYIEHQKVAFKDCQNTEDKLIGSNVYKKIDKINNGSNSNHQIINSSSDELFVLLFEDTQWGKVEGYLLAPEDTLNLTLTLQQCFIFYSGKQMVAIDDFSYLQNNTINESVDIKAYFTHHFCKQKSANFKQLNRVYEVNRITDKTFFSGNAQQGFEIESLALSLRK